MNNIIRIATRKKGLTSADMAAQLGCSVASYRNTLSRGTMCARTLEKIAYAAGCEWALFDRRQGIIYYKGGSIENDQLRK